MQINIHNPELVNIREKYNYEKVLDMVIDAHDPMLNNTLIKKHQNWDITKNVSDIATNCVEWIPIKETDVVLEIGAEYGNVTELLSKRSAQVRAVELDYIKCQMINKRTKVFENTQVWLGYIDELLADWNMHFDKIFLINALSRAKTFVSENFLSINNDIYISFISLLKQYLSNKGQIILIEDNKLGVKYFNGAKVNENEEVFSSIEDKQMNGNQRLFSKAEYDHLFETIKFNNIKRYYPYPDYKFTDTIYSEERKPLVGELKVNRYNWEKYGYNLFDDSNVLNTFIKEGLFTHFSNSFLFVLSDDMIEELPVYIKYSNERAYQYKIKTQIYENNGKQKVLKIPMTSIAKKHLEKMYKTYIGNVYSNGIIKLSPLEYKDGIIKYDYIYGVSLAGIVDKYILNRDYDEVFNIFYILYDFLIEDKVQFSSSSYFEAVFGNYCSNIDEQNLAVKYNNLDFILDNIIVSKDGIWNIIDYEWKFDFLIPAKYVLWRSIFYLQKSQNDGQENIEWKNDLYDKFDISIEMQENFFQMEKNFQKFIINNSLPVRNMKILSTNVNGKANIEIYKKKDGEFSVKEREIIHNIKSPDNRTKFEIMLRYNECSAVRIDPTSCPCLIKVNSVTNGYGQKIHYKTNCQKNCGSEAYLFKTNDPQIIINDMSKVVDKIVLDYYLFELPTGISI